MNFTPSFKILANDRDVTDHIQKNLIALNFKDEAGILSDEITLEVAGEFRRPKYQDKLKVWIGYKESGLWYCGDFCVQSSERTQHSTNITATGVDFSNTLKEKKSRSWEKLSLKEVVEKIAKEHQLGFQAEFEEAKIVYLAQSDESDLSFLKRLAKEYGAMFSIKDNKILFLYKKESEKLPVAKVNLLEAISFSIKHSNKTIYLSARAIWHDTKENKSKEVVVGNGMPQLRIESAFKNSSDAKLKAQAKLKNANSGSISGRLSIYGSKIYAGGLLELNNAGSDNGVYQINSVNHTLSVDGFITDVWFEK